MHPPRLPGGTGAGVVDDSHLSDRERLAHRVGVREKRRARVRITPPVVSVRP